MAVNALSIAQTLEHIAPFKLGDKVYGVTNTGGVYYCTIVDLLLFSNRIVLEVQQVSRNRLSKLVIWRHGDPIPQRIFGTRKEADENSAKVAKFYKELAED